MENKSHAFWAGLFTIGLLAAIAAAVFWFNMDRTVRVPYDLIARTSVNGLSPEVNPGQIIIRILVDKHTPMTHSTYASLGLQGVTGLAFVQLDDTGHDLAPLVSTSKNVAQLPLRPGLLDELQRRGDAMLREIEMVTQDMHRMLGEDTRDQLLATNKSIQQAADGVTALTRQLAPAVAQMPATVTQLDRTLASTNVLMVNLNSPNGRLMSNLDRVGNAADQTGAALAQLNLTVQDIGARVGYETLPRVDSLADDVRSASRSFERAADMVGGNPRSLLFGAPPAPPGPGEAGFHWPAPASSNPGSSNN
jgi:phospholipid/cholesterol/gamma-HCH transport system substrate-binding protein